MFVFNSQDRSPPKERLIKSSSRPCKSSSRDSKCSSTPEATYWSRETLRSTDCISRTRNWPRMSRRLSRRSTTRPWTSTSRWLTRWISSSTFTTPLRTVSSWWMNCSMTSRHNASRSHLRTKLSSPPLATLKVRCKSTRNGSKRIDNWCLKATYKSQLTSNWKFNQSKPSSLMRRLSKKRSWNHFKILLAINKKLKYKRLTTMKSIIWETLSLILLWLVCMYCTNTRNCSTWLRTTLWSVQESIEL